MNYRNKKSKLLFRLYIWISLLTIYFFGCSTEPDEQVIAKVNDHEIPVTEFQLRYNFNPYLKTILSENIAKKIVLSAMIAEKILFLESIDINSPSEELLQLRQQYMSESMIEKIRQDSIESQIEITDQELKKEYLKSLKEIDIQFVAFNSLEEANRIKNKIDSLGSFEKPIRKYMDTKGWKNESIPTKKISWGNEQYVLEESVYNLDIDETSSPVRANNEYYLIKVTGITKTGSPTDQDFGDRLPALRDRIARYKIKIKYNKFYNKHIRNNMGNVNWNMFRKVVDVLVSEIEFNQDPEMQDYNKPLKEIYYPTLLNKIRDNMDAELINFPDESSWSVEEVLNRLNIGPYAFNFKNEVLFRRSCARNIELLQEYHAIYNLAKEYNYEDNAVVLEQYTMWNAFYSSGEQRHNLLDKVKEVAGDSAIYSNSKLSVLQNKRLSVFDTYLSNVSEKYSIRINKKLFNSVKLNKQDMVVVKSHFANRLIAPPLEPLNSLPKWSAKFNSILQENEIQL